MEKPIETNETGGNGEKTAKRKQERVFSKYVLPSNRHGFGVQFDLLRRYVALGRTGGVAASQVEGEGIPVQAGSMNVRFLRSIGLLGVAERGLYVPTREAVQFINAKTVSDEKARPILAALLAKTWFGELAQYLFGTQPIMNEDQFLGELALAAQTDKAKEQLALRTILEYLIYSGILVRDERGLSLGSATGRSESVEASTEGTGQMAPPNDIRTPDKPLAEPSGWHIVQTEDFYVKVKSDLDVVEDLIAHLETVKRKILRLKGEGRRQSEDDGQM